MFINRNLNTQFDCCVMSYYLKFVVIINISRFTNLPRGDLSASGLINICILAQSTLQFVFCTMICAQIINELHQYLNTGIITSRYLWN